MRRVFVKHIAFVAGVLWLTGCAPSPSLKDKLELYNDVLDQIVSDNYFQYCLVLDERHKEIQNDFYDGRIDTATYLKIGDSLKSARKSTLPKCELDYANEFQILTRNHELSNDLKTSVSENLKDRFLTENFPGVSPMAIIDTLSQTAQLSAKDLTTGYLEIIPYGNRAHKPYGGGMGVMGFSRVYFNKELDKAILYYEFNCGPKCGTGEVVFVEKVSGKWRVDKYKRVWDS